MSVASGSKVFLNMRGVRAVYKSPEVAAELERLGGDIAAAANAAGVPAFEAYHHGRPPDCPPYRAALNEHRRMNACIVRAVGRHGAAIEARHGILRGLSGR